MEENRNVSETLKKIYDSLTDEQKEKIKACKTDEEVIKFAGEEGIELHDEILDNVAGGVQAGLITEGGSGEFGPKKKEKPDPSPRKTWL